MKKVYLAFLCLAFAFAGCMSGEKKKVFDFNQKLAGISQGLASKGTAFGTELKAAVNSKDFSKTASTCKDLKDYVDAKIEEVRATENVGGSETLKATMLEFLQYEKQLITEGFEPFGRMNKDTPEEEVQAAVKAMMDKSTDENQYLSKVQKEQKLFADKNGLKLKE